MITKNLSSAYFWSVVNHYQSFSFFILIKIFSIIASEQTTYMQSILVEFIICYIIPYIQVIFPPISFFILLLISEETTDSQMKKISFVCILLCLYIFYLTFIIMLGNRSKMNYITMMIKHNFSLFIAGALVSNLTLKIAIAIFAIFALFSVGYLMVIKIADASIFGDNIDITRHLSEFKYLRKSYYPLLFHLFLMGKKTLLVVMLSIYEVWVGSSRQPLLVMACIVGITEF